MDRYTDKNLIYHRFLEPEIVYFITHRGAKDKTLGQVFKHDIARIVKLMWGNRDDWDVVLFMMWVGFG